MEWLCPPRTNTSHPPMSALHPQSNTRQQQGALRPLSLGAPAPPPPPQGWPCCALTFMLAPYHCCVCGGGVEDMGGLLWGGCNAIYDPSDKI